MKFKAQFSLPVNTSYTGKVFELDLPCKPSPGDRIASDDKLFSRHLNAMYKSLDSKIVEGYYDFSFVREIMYKNGETHVIIGIHPSHFLVAFTTDEGMYLCETPVRPVVGDVILDSTVEVRKVHLRSDYLFSIDGTYFDEEAFEDEYDDVDKFDFYDDVEEFEPDFESKDEDGDEDGPDDQSDPEAKHKGGNKGGGTLPPFHVPRGKKPFMN